MGRKPCCAKEGLQRGAWTEEEDCILRNYINHHGEGKWRDLPQRAGLKRCGKSCRLRWLNYLRPNIKRGNFSADEEELIIRLHKLLGNRWSLIAGRLPGRTDNEIKNYWNTKLSKRAFQPPQKTDHQDQFNKKLTAEKGGLKDRAVAKEDTTEPLKQVIRTKAVRCTKAVVSVAQQLENLEPAKPDISKAKENPFSLAVGDQDNDKGINFLKDLDNDEFVLIPDVNVGSSCSEIRTKAVRCTKAIVPAALELENLPSKSDMSKVEEKSLSLFSSTVGYQDKDEYINFLMDVDINELLVQDLNLGSCPDIGTKAMRCTEGIVSAALQLEPSKSETSRAEQSPYSLAVEDHDNEKCIHFLKDLDIDKVFTPDVNVSSSCGDIQIKVARCTEAIVPATLELQNLSPSKSDVNSRTQQSPFHLAVGDWEKDGCIDFLMDFNINEFLTTDVN